VPTWTQLNRSITNCNLCPRLREHCQTTARIKRASFATEKYWGRPVPNWAAADVATVRLLIVGLAPSAHGANRTGRMFTGDRSGDFLFHALHEAGLASQPTSLARGDGLELIACAITATCHCAPPDNKPSPVEVANCQGFLDDTLAALPNVRGLIALGRIGWDASIRMLTRAGYRMPKPAAAPFGHGTVAWSDNRRKFVIGSYHPSQQNTFTGRLTAAMLRDVLRQAHDLANNADRSGNNSRPTII
jgi:uracil-DNA glycosylase family 4